MDVEGSLTLSTQLVTGHPEPDDSTNIVLQFWRHLLPSYEITQTAVLIKMYAFLITCVLHTLPIIVIVVVGAAAVVVVVVVVVVIV
jgi:hypothetical protein